jgi:UDPglucose 6-dehydrogenase
MNNYQETRFVRAIVRGMFNTIVGKRIALFGFAFKADTGDTRETPALYISRLLLEEQAKLVITDPKALENAKIDLADVLDKIELTEDPYLAAAGAHAVAVVTEWDCYRTLDWEKIYQSMEKPAFIFDGRNILDHRRLFEIGFNLYPIGKPAMKHFKI